MKAIFKQLFILVIILCGINLFGQEVKLPFILSKDKTSIFLKLPLENQKDSLLFFFDTGAGITMIDSDVAHKKGFVINSSINVSGAGGKKRYDMMTGYKLKLDQNTVMDSISIVLDDFSRLTELYEKKFDGIIGSTILGKYLTKIDFGTQTISLYKFGTPLDYTGYQKLPIEFYGSNLAKLPITLELTNGEKFQGDVLFDSGAGVTLIVNRPYKEEHKLYEKLDKKITYAGNNLSNKTYYEKGIIKNIQLGNYTIEKSDMAISLSSDTSGVSADVGIVGIMGSEIIHRFDLILDYKEKAIYIKSNHLYTKDFEPLVNPLSLRYNNDRTEIIIANVIEGTDAYKKGLREGYRILSINGISYNDFTDYQEILKKENKKVSIKYSDEKGKVKTANISLTRIL